MKILTFQIKRNAYEHNEYTNFFIVYTYIYIHTYINTYIYVCIKIESQSSQYKAHNLRKYKLKFLSSIYL
jgi:hypothetical protein